MSYLFSSKIKILKLFHHQKIAFDGDRVSVTCKVAGEPKPEVTWFRNKEALRKTKVCSFYLSFDVFKFNPKKTGFFNGAKRRSSHTCY